MKLTFVITKQQAAKILNAIPLGKSITIRVGDANKILNNATAKKQK
jgi:hypothetical protein